jgi:two-component system sensor histidine kinase SenX3
MTASASRRTHRFLLAGSLVLVVLAAAVAGRVASGATAWLVAGALLAAAALVGFLLHRAAADDVALHAEAEHLAARLAQFGEAQGRFVDGIAHQIRTPLTIVLNHAELLLRCSDDAAAVRGHAKSLADYSMHVSALLDGFLRLGSPFAAADASHRVPVHVHDLILEAVRRCQSSARGGGVGIVPTIAEPEPEERGLEVSGDAVLLEALVETLVRHAVRRSPRGSRVDLQVEISGEVVLLRVRDRGTGIAPAQLDSVFDWFFKAPGTAQQAQGNGGALAIARRIAEHHRGTIALHNHPDGGCEFEVMLPRWRGDVVLPPEGEVPVRPPPLARPA